MYSCSCLSALPGFARVLLNIISKPFFLYPVTSCAEEKKWNHHAPRNRGVCAGLLCSWLKGAASESGLQVVPGFRVGKHTFPSVVINPCFLSWWIAGKFGNICTFSLIYHMHCTGLHYKAVPLLQANCGGSGKQQQGINSPNLGMALYLHFANAVSKKDMDFTRPELHLLL